MTVRTVTGGCICCAAQGKMTSALNRLCQLSPPLDGLLIEPSGISEPETLVDLLSGHEAVDLRGVIAVLDAGQHTPEQLQRWQSLQSMLMLADMVLVNKTDRATRTDLTALLDYLASLYPPKACVETTRHGRIPLEKLRQLQPYRGLKPLRPHTDPAPAHISRPAEADWSFHPLPHLIDRHVREGHARTLSWHWAPEARFHWRSIQQLFEQLNQPPFLEVLRAKAVLRINDRSWMSFQWASGEMRRSLSSWRRDSRLEVILAPESRFNADRFEQALLTSQQMASAVA